MDRSFDAKNELNGNNTIPNQGPNTKISADTNISTNTSASINSIPEKGADILSQDLSWKEKISSFYVKNDLGHNIYDSIQKLPRYVRVVGFPCKFDYEQLFKGDNNNIDTPFEEQPSCDSLNNQVNALSENDVTAIAKQLQKELGCEITKSKAVLGLLRIADGNAKINNTELYKSGKIIGIDQSSAIAALSLQIQPNDHILDLCCAPGAKLLLMADILAGFGQPSAKSHGSITGVDISAHRMSTCKSLIKKSKSQGKVRIRLFVADGTKFAFLPPHDYWWDYGYHKAISKKRKKKSHEIDLEAEIEPQPQPQSVIPWFAPKLLRTECIPRYQTENTRGISQNLYDKVLVDAECTHDGSLVHLTKYITNQTNAKLDSDFLSDERVKSVSNLQFHLLLNGWNSLKPGGTLIYSTCSLSYKQNEDVVARFLSHIHSKNQKIEKANKLQIEKILETRSHLQNEAQKQSESSSSQQENSPALNNRSQESDSLCEYAIIEPLDQILLSNKQILPTSPLQLSSAANHCHENLQSVLDNLSNCLRLDPRVSDTSGMFIAKVRKASCK